jgi:clan AA aspartic protease
LAWRIRDNTLLVPIRLSNPLLEAECPEDGFLMAVLDTGYTGFILVPPAIFSALKLGELRPTNVKGELANGRSIELQAAYGLLRIPELEFEEEGLVETNPEITATLLGMRATRRRNHDRWMQKALNPGKMLANSIRPYQRVSFASLSNMLSYRPPLSIRHVSV